MSERTQYVSLHRNVYLRRGVEITAERKAVAVIRLDALLRATGAKVGDVEALDRHPGMRSVVQLREVLSLRLDMGWERWKVAVEFDGAQHWTDRRQRSRDIDRIAELETLGWTVVWVSGEMLRDRPWVVVQRVRAALRAAGCPI